MQPTSVLALFLAALAVCPASSLRGSTNRAFLANGARLQPQVVAHTLFQMEDEWRSQAALFAECNATTRNAASCSAATKAFEKSCATVVKAVQAASSGDRSVVTEYMGDICSQTVLEGWRKERCQSLASTMSGAMTADNYQNREDLDVAGLCKNYWSNFAAAETARVIKERAEEEAKRVAREAEEKKLAEERAVAAKKAAEEAVVKAAAASKKAAEEAAKRKVEEAARQAAEAKHKAEEEAAEAKRKAEEEAKAKKEKAEKEAEELKAKEELALRKAEEAKKNMEQAQAAADAARNKRAATAAKVAKGTNATEKVANNTSHTVNATKAATK